MNTPQVMEKRFRARQPDWRGREQRRFRWSKLRFEYGRYCYIVHPVEGGRDIVWWEWEAQPPPAVRTLG